MKKNYLFFIIFSISTVFTINLHAQDVETLWANKVIDVSSSYKQGLLFKDGLRYNKYPAERILGNPDVLPGNSGDSPNAWVPQKPDRKEFVKIGFEYPIKIQQIAIAESRNPGAVTEIYTYDLQGNEELVAELEASPVNSSSRLYNVFIDPTGYEVYSIKIVIDGSKVAGINAIDAVAISSSPIPINAEINIAENVNPNLETEVLDFNTEQNFISLKPIIAPDGNMLFFSRRSPENVGGETDPEDIWYSERNLSTNSWSDPKNIGRPLNNKGSNFVSAVTVDENNNYVLLLGNAYLDDNKMISGVSTSTKQENGWSNPRSQNISNFYNYAMSANYFLSNDQRYLLMAVERDDTYGGLDLYISFKQGSNSWTQPINLGNQINTPDIESSPFIAADDSTLFFSSRGYSGFGGEDVYVSYRLDDSWQNWSEPKNLGSDINSSRDDTFFNIGLNEEYAYLTRGKIDQADLYRVTMPIFTKPAVPANQYLVQGLVYNVKNNMPVDAEIIITPISQGEDNIAEQSQEDGNYSITLTPGEYEISARKEGYTSVDPQHINLAALDDDGDRIVLRDLYLIRDFRDVDIKDELLTNRAAIAAEEVLFDINQAKLSKRAYRQLRRVAEFMNENPEAKLLITGHTCDLGRSQFNMKLSQNRAEAVAGFLERQGVSPLRIETRGYGESEPLVQNSNPSNRKINRRVEFTVRDN
ncbi:OOP family OmpA-OmpF porin [Catalinimonas alkaloidigena]|uniref:OmpA family protein n=1 Tax=Catalinimonas alkaloidigena TaxID=1075417 RepID=UPI002405BE1E|nr:OmpA family protein [Catalinimonas alkaloidigena]MDF9795780.1 OOP family OmpA-OmpF porin [Catalinimonas alkaloidigena]